MKSKRGEKFCPDCGAKLQLNCPGCGVAVLPGNKFCGQCGHEIEPSPLIKEEALPSERKYITALFADISGYTSIAELLDPEDVKDITVRLMVRIAPVISKYGGAIENYSGDQVMAVFGIPRAHEDDPVRAIRAAMEIHRVVGEDTLKYQGRIGRPLKVHIGINSGLVATGAIGLEKLERHVAGDAVNVASRLCDIAKGGETLVGQNTHTQAEGFFSFEALPPMKVKGKTKPVPVYRLLSPKELPSKRHRISGLRADLVGRKREMAKLQEAAARLLKGEGSVIAISGEAGTGKSRLKEEFKVTLNQESINWIEGHAYAYSQNISYHPIIDIITRQSGIKEDDSPDQVREKLEKRLRDLHSPVEKVAPYIGGLLSLSYPEAEGVSPDFWKASLHQALHATLAAIAQLAPTIICLEDLHWADSSSLEFLRTTVLENSHHLMFLITHRPPFVLFDRRELELLGDSFQELKLRELSPEEMQEMMKSILKAATIPDGLRTFVQEKVEGNPFYLEEIINSLIESGTLVPTQSGWELNRPFGDMDIPVSVHSVINARLDRLNPGVKSLLQEASVIGRAFHYEILKKVTRHPDDLDRCLHDLEYLDFIRAEAPQSDEYFFKHALIQEVVYDSLLRKDRQTMHHRTGEVMENVFHDRLLEFCETLAYHFQQGEFPYKAVDYLIKSGRKSLKKYAVEESHQYYNQALAIASGLIDQSDQGKNLLIDLLNEWALVFYYRSDSLNFVNLFNAHKELAESLDDSARLGMFYAWFGHALFLTENIRESYNYCQKALLLGEEIGNHQIIGLACGSLTWTCAELKFLDRGIQYGMRAQELAKQHDLDPMIFFMSMGGLGMIYLIKGDSNKNFEIGKTLLDYGRNNKNFRCIIVGHICLSYGYYTIGDFSSAIECNKKAIDILPERIFFDWPKLILSMTYMMNNQFLEAEKLLPEILSSTHGFGVDYIGTSAHALLGAVLIARGKMSRGLEMVEEGLRSFSKNERGVAFYIIEFSLGEIYFQMLKRDRPINLSMILKNLGFFLKEFPQATRRQTSISTRRLKWATRLAPGAFCRAKPILIWGTCISSSGERRMPKPASRRQSKSLHTVDLKCICNSQERLY